MANQAMAIFPTLNIWEWSIRSGILVRYLTNAVNLLNHNQNNHVLRIYKLFHTGIWSI